MAAVRTVFLVVMASIALVVAGCGTQPPSDASSSPSPQGPHPVPVEKRSSIAKWPWASPQRVDLRAGMTRTSMADAGDGTTAWLFEFDCRANPRFHFELYDRDEDDTRPDDDVLIYTDRRKAPWVFAHLAPRGRVLFTCNGPFFAFNHTYSHTAPVVRRGTVRHFVGNPRWSLGVNEGPRGPQFKLVHAATREQLAKFDWGSGNVQALVVGGKPRQLPAPSSEQPGPRSPPSTESNCGPYPLADYLKTARTSLGWREGVFAILLVTQAPGQDENTSNARRINGLAQPSGWDIADLQQFWVSWGAVGACNLDGGLCTEACYLAHAGPEALDSNSNTPHPTPEDAGQIGSAGALLYPYIVER